MIRIRSKKNIGVIYVILSATLFGMMPLLTRIAYAHGSNAYTAAFFRFFFGSLFLGAAAAASNRRTGNSFSCLIKIDRDQFFSLLKLSILYALIPIMLYTSYDHIDSGMATTLHFTYPVAVMLIMAVFCKVRPDVKQVVCAFLCVGGMALQCAPGGRISVTGVVLAVVSGILYAVYVVILGRSSARTLPSLVLAFWVSFLAAVEIGLIAFFSGRLTLRMDVTGWAAHVGLSLLATTFALTLFQKGMLLCGEVRASLFSTFEPLTSIAIGVAVFGETLSPREICGITGILSAVVLLVLPVGKAAPNRP